MRRALITPILALLSVPAFAQEPTTLDHVTTKGVVMHVGGMDIAVKYMPDGKFTAMDGAVTGQWKRDGDTMCSTNNMDPTEVCVAYPKDKKPGDTFEITSPQGPISITINK
jgi:hypothetical protein